MTPTLAKSAINKGADSILYSTVFAILDICRNIIIKDLGYSTLSISPSHNPQNRLLHAGHNDSNDSIQNLVFRHDRYFLYSFPPLYNGMSLTFQRKFSSGSESFFYEKQQSTDIEKTPSISVGFPAEEGTKNLELGSDAPQCDGSDNFRKICKIVKTAEENIEVNLAQMNVKLSPQLVIDVLRHISDHPDSALRFFTWAKEQPGYSHNAAVYNEIINIEGVNGGFEVMGFLIEEMREKGHSLTDKAFSFMLSSPSIKSIVEKLLDTFSKMEYPGRKVAYHCLLSVLYREKLFGVAMSVLQDMTRRGKPPSISYYNALIASKCQNGQLLEARGLLNEMKRSGREPDTSSYNYLLGTLCKMGKITDACQLLDVMEKSGHRSDPITYEILITCACKAGKTDGALEFLNKMIKDGLRPRYSTYAAFIKGYFNTRQFEEAYNFMVETSKKDPSADSMNYTLLASLFEKSGMMLEARGVLLKMIERSLIPKFSLCRKVINGLFQSGKHDLAQELQCKLTEATNILNWKKP